MAKIPYIPLYIGDWEQDTNCISLEAEGALLKIIFKLWKADDKGRLLIGFNQLSILLKNSPENCRKIVSELAENGILNVEFRAENSVFFESRRMLKDIAKSLAMSENGRQGGRPKKANQKQTKSQPKAKEKPNADNEYENDIDNESVNGNKKGGTGEKQKPPHPGVIEVIQYLNELNGTNLRTDTKATVRLIQQRFSEGYTLTELKEIIEYKIAEWRGTDQEKWIQPDTLFNGEKCAKYRNQVQAAKDKGLTASQIKGNNNPKLNKDDLAQRVAALYGQ